MNNYSMHARILVASCITAGVLFGQSASAQTELLPNLEPFPASNLVLVDNGNSVLTLRFSATTWNRGAGPLELRGGEVVIGAGQNVYQYVLRDDGTYTAPPYLVGTFVFHDEPGHDHFHLENYARYTLQPLSGTGGSGRQGAKISFCILDNTRVRTNLPNAPKKAVYLTCNPDVQGMSVGWGDTYRNYLAGQSLDFSGNPSGDYLLKIEVNPNHQIKEADYTDNVSCARLRVDLRRLSVRVFSTTCP